MSPRSRKGLTPSLLMGDPFHSMASEIEEESDLIKIALLADSIRDRLKEQIFRLEQLIRGRESKILTANIVP